METQAFFNYEWERDRRSPDDEDGQQELANSIGTAVRRALDQVPPSNSFVPHHDLQSAGLIPANMTLNDRALCEAGVLNLHILRPSHQ